MSVPALRKHMQRSAHFHHITVAAVTSFNNLLNLIEIILIRDYDLMLTWMLNKVIRQDVYLQAPKVFNQNIQ